MPSSTHQAKRPYAGTHSQHRQSSITSYFTTPSDTSSSGPSTQRTSEPSPFPVLPTSIQSSLLNVGMRVRKSVPEGYKTGTYSSFGLFSDQAPAVQKLPPQQQKTKQKRYVGAAAARELAPFCGIMKVGGLAQQVSVLHEEEGDMCLDDEDVPNEDDFPGLSSQGSTLSNFSTAVTQKRRLSTASDEEHQWADEEISPKSVFPQPGQVWGSVTERTLAVPRRRVKAAGVAVRGQGTAIAGGDFEDAGFLDYEALEEVNMGGL